MTIDDFTFAGTPLSGKKPLPGKAPVADSSAIHVPHTRASVQLGTLEEALADNTRLRAELSVCRQADASRQASEVKYQCLYNNMADVFVGMRMNGQLIDFNPALQIMLGYSAEELYQLTYLDLTPAKWHALENRILQDQILSLGHSCVYEKEYRRKDGTIFPVELRTFLVRDEAGLPASIWAIVRDITERKHAEEKLRESEERFRTVLQQSIDVAYRRNLKTDRYDYLSPAAERITGFTVDEFCQLSSADLLELIHPDDHPVISKRFEQFEKSRYGLQIQDLFEYRIKRKDGEYRCLSDSGILITDPDGTPLYHVGVARDVTERKRMEDALRQSNERLEKTVVERTSRLRRLATELTLAEQRERRRISDFLHDDLQQVLVAAKFRSEKLAADLSAQAHENEARKLHALMMEALEKTRAITKDLGTPLLYVMGFFPALRQLAEQMLERHGLRIDLDIQDVPDVFQEDIKVQLFHSVRELLFNVAKHADTRIASLRIRRQEDQIEITVADTGKGFTPDIALQEVDVAGGYGLFSISERLEIIGGHLKIESAPGCGTRIVMSVPIPPAPLGQPTTLSGKPVITSHRLMESKKRARVLVADDHTLVRNGVVNLLATDTTLEVVGEAVNGQEALDLSRQFRPDVVVMDVRMPIMDGLEATRQIMSQLPDTIVVGMSAFGESGFKNAMLEAGAVCLLDKGEASETLIATIARCLAARKNRAPTFGMATEG